MRHALAILLVAFLLAVAVLAVVQFKKQRDSRSVPPRLREYFTELMLSPLARHCGSCT
jgi:hypothetical protein